MQKNKTELTIIITTGLNPPLSIISMSHFLKSISSINGPNNPIAIVEKISDRALS